VVVFERLQNANVSKTTRGAAAQGKPIRFFTGNATMDSFTPDEGKRRKLAALGRKSLPQARF